MSIRLVPDSAAPDGFEIRGAKGGAKGGRSIHASRSFHPGDVIARFDNADVVLPPGHRALEYCNHCLKNEGTPGVGKLRACTACKTVAYCGPACQKANWTLIHKLECKAIKRLLESKPAHQPDWIPTPIRAATQVLLRPKVVEKFKELEGHVEKWRKRDEMDLQLQSLGTARCVGTGAATAQEMEEAFQVLCKLQTNAFSRTEEYHETGGVFLDTTLAMVNHSCVPNAMVQFSGRSAILRSLLHISPGDEIEISYIDHTQPKGKRQGELDLYHFECACRKCEHDLDQYQIARYDPTIDLNRFSVMPDIGRFRNPPGSDKLVPEPQGMQGLEVQKIMPVSPRDMKPKEKHEWLRKAYKRGKYFVDMQKYAIEPFAQVVDEASYYYGKDRGNHECALTVACFLAREIEPWKHIAPFHPHRLKGLSSIAIALSNTAPTPGKLTKLARDMAALKEFEPKHVEVVENLDQVSLCQMVLTIIDMFGQMCPSPDWEPLVLAREMLKDIESLEGREKENALVSAWRKDPKDMAAFFNFAVINPVHALSELGKAVLEVDLGKDRDLSVK